MGGHDKWEATHHITWSFFGKRLHVWDKWTGAIRVEADDLVVLMNINTSQGRAWKAGNELTDGDLKQALQDGMEMWINDAYWMFMPYKLKDSGVTLKYNGTGTTEEGASADVLQLTFADVGVTPENRYLVYVDHASRLVVQWDYYANATDEDRRFTTPWANWKQMGEILLSDNRGKGQHTDIAVYQSLPASIYTSPEPMKLP